MSGPSAEEPVRPDIVGFLRARLDEDERDAKAARTKHDWTEGSESFDEDSGGNLRGDGRSSVNDGPSLFATPIVVVHEDWKYPPQPYELVEHIARHDPARVLREVEAKRRIVDRCRWILESFEDREHGMWPDVNRRERHHARVTLEDLAGVYDQHPDYDPAWRPS